MASVTGYTAARMQAIEDQAIVDGSVVGDNLILERHNGTTINAGSVRGPGGPPGPSGSVGGTLGSTDNRVVRSDGVSGTVIQGSSVEIDDFGRLTAPLMTVTTAPSVGTDVVNKAYSDSSGRGVLGLKVHNATVLTDIPQDAYNTLSSLDITLTPVVGRFYRFTAQATGNPTTSVALLFGLSIWRTSDAQPFIRAFTNTTATLNPSTATISRIFQIPTGWDVSTTFRVRTWANGPTNVQNDIAPAHFSIEDVGSA